MNRRIALALALTTASSLRAADARPAFECGAGPAEASPEERARTLFEEALRLEAAEPTGALERLRCADGLVARPAVALRIGTVAERLGRLDEAIAGYRRYLALAGAAAPDREAMDRRVASLEARLAADGEAAGKSGALDLKWPGILVGSAGVVLGAVGAVFLGVAQGQSDSVHAIAPGTTSWSSAEARDTFAAAERNEVVGIVGLALGGALTLAGATMLVVTVARSPGEAGEHTARVTVTPTGATLSLAF